MRLLETLPDAPAARSLSDLLEVHGVQNEVREMRDGHAVWVLDDSDLQRARDLARGADTADARSAAREAAAIRERRARERRPLRARAAPRAALAPRAGPAVMTLIGLSVLVELVKMSGHNPMPDLAIARLEHLPRVVLDLSQPWRLVTPIFLHFGLFHLGFNMLWLHRLGSQIESQHGALRTLALVVASAVAGNVLQLLLSGPLFGGMSGVNYGLFGFVWAQARYAPQRRYAIVPADVWLLMGWLVLCATGWLGPVANAAHAAGLVVGLVAGLPAYIAFRRVYGTERPIEAGSWEDLNVHGWQRFERVYVEPYLPVWFLGIALGVLVYAELL